MLRVVTFFQPLPFVMQTLQQQEYKILLQEKLLNAFPVKNLVINDNIESLIEYNIIIA